MRVDPIQPPAQFAPRKGHAGRLETALLGLAGGHGRVIEHRERSWASITFAGTRHRLQIVFDTAEAVDGGEALIANLPDHEFTLPGRLVADATISAVDHVAGPSPSLTVTCELLLLEDG